MSEPVISDKPTLIVTGASGFIGRNLLEAIKDEFIIYAIARRSQNQVNIQPHPNIKWLQVDISNRGMLDSVITALKKQGQIDYVLHLAGYYDFDYKDCPQYLLTNIKGTRYMLEAAKALKVKRFIFASSVAACNFPVPGSALTEQSPVDAQYPYAVSKRRGEEMVEEYSRYFPCSIVRLAAVFSDWCEYGPLYMFLSTWLSRKWNARILGGKGHSSVPYIHVRDLIKLFMVIIRDSHQLPPLGTYNASPDGSTSHLDLFGIATRYYYRDTVKPVFMPRFIAYPGVIARDLLGRVIGNRPFERPWMMKYLDLRLDVDAAHTRGQLEWEPTPRFHIQRRILFLIEHMISNPNEWHAKNQAALKHAALQPNYILYERFLELKDQLTDACKNHLLSPSRSLQFRNYQEMGPVKVRWYLGTLIQLLMSVVRTGDRMLILNYARDLARLRHQEGFKKEEVCSALQELAEIIIARLAGIPELKKMDQLIYNCIGLTMQLAVDEVEDAYEQFMSAPLKPSRKREKEKAQRLSVEEIERQIREYETDLQNQIQRFFLQ